MSISNANQVWLEIYTADEATEIFVLNGQFHVVETGLGYLQTLLNPGIYKVKVCAGYETQEELVILPEGETHVTKNFSAIRFASPVPMSNTAQTYEDHMAAAAQHSRKIHVNAGVGSQIFVFARRWTAQNHLHSPSNHQNPARGLVLKDELGESIVDVCTQSAFDLSGNSWAACNVQVTPGLYRLCLTTPAGITIEQTIVASPGWQTQIFLLQQAYNSTSDDERVDLPSAAILLTRDGFDPGRTDMRLTELVRLGLTNQRKALSTNKSAMLWEKWEKYDNPMLGIFSAHLLLLDPKLDLALLHRVIIKLRSLLGSHPDVEALALQLGPDEHTYTFKVPPMLRRSWSLVINASVTKPDLVPLDSLAAQVAVCLWGEEPWLMWMTSLQVNATHSLTDKNEISQGMQTNGFEKALMTQLELLGKTRELSGLESTEQQLDNEIVQKLTQILGIPRANIEQMWKKGTSSSSRTNTEEPGEKGVRSSPRLSSMEPEAQSQSYKYTNIGAAPLLFVHGPWHGDWCWHEYFVPYFTQAGYSVYTLSLRGHGPLARRNHLRWTRIQDYVTDLETLILQRELLQRAPILIGHSMGSLVVQKYMQRHQGTAVAGVLMAPIPPQGSLAAMLRIARQNPIAFAKVNATLSLYPLVETPALAQSLLFSATMPQDQVLNYFTQLQDESYRAFLDMMLPNLANSNRIRAPLLVLGAANDAIFTPAEVAATARAYGTTATIFPNMAHDMMLGSGWQAVADTILNWLSNMDQEAYLIRDLPFQNIFSSLFQSIFSRRQRVQQN
jgi:alpha-beta hydrolase superfamily lysophospholipase